MKEKKKVELLAPAGNAEAFYGAIHAGADAVYLGGSRFGARAYADNFTEEELISCIRYAHLFGRKVYLTVNTLVKEVEFSEVYDYLLPFYEAGLDGVIVQDIGVFSYVREHFPDMELHVSTQMTLTGKYGAEMLKEMGACRVVPARELSLVEIKEMKAHTGLEIETFIHGAMCYCYSGQCLFSSILGGRSGNRGRCAQPCRLPYRVQNDNKTTDECYPLSLKDMCTIEHLPELIEAGIDSFKIEGRMKKPEYAAGVTAIYRKYIDKYYKDPQKPFKVSEKDLNKLSSLYIRSERQDGYYYKHNGKEMVTLSQPSYSGSDDALLQQIRSEFLEKSPKLPICVYATFVVGEEAAVTFLYEDFSVTVTGDVVQEAQKQPISEENIEKQLGKLGDSIFCADTISVTLSGHAFYPLKAINELRRSAVSRLEDMLIQRHGLPVRRACSVDSVKESCKDNLTCPASGENASSRMNALGKASGNSMTVSVQTMDQLRFLHENIAEYPIAKIYVDGDLLIQQKDAFTLLTDLSHREDLTCIIALPYILRAKDEAYLRRLSDLAIQHQEAIAGFLVRNMEGMGFLQHIGYRGRIYTDAGFYVWNRRTLEEWADSISGYCMPYELKSGEQRALGDSETAYDKQRAMLHDGLTCEKIFYGRIPMMITANCVVRTTEQCHKGTKTASVRLIDRYQKKFPVMCNCYHCMNIIYNSVPLSLHGEWSKWQGDVAMRLDFTLEAADEMQAILNYFTKVYQNNAMGMKLPIGMEFPIRDYTTGHEKRGVE